MTEKVSLEKLAERLTEAAAQVEVGALYKHYKGNLYRVLHLAILEVADEPCVVYQANYGNQLTFVRPVSNWLEEVDQGNQAVPRFAKV